MYIVTNSNINYNGSKVVLEQLLVEGYPEMKQVDDRNDNGMIWLCQQWQ